MGLFIQLDTSYKAATHCFLNFGTPFLYSFMFALLRPVPKLKSGITLLIFALEQKLKVHWTFLLREQAENSLDLPRQSLLSLHMTKSL